MSEQRFVSRPLVHHPHALADRQPDAWPVLRGPLEDAARFVEVVAGVEQQLDPLPVPAPLLDLIEVAAVGIRPDRRSPRRTSRSSITLGALVAVAGESETVARGRPGR